MKTNEPTSDNEIGLPADAILVSKTDHRGVISYVNPAFAAISGFGESELLGSSHNIVRHPDMPAAVYRDLWQTIESGRTWSGVIKNRAKSGDFYWVRANVTQVPLADGGVEYMSVRTAANARERRAAEAHYARVNAGEAPHPPSAPTARQPAERVIGLGTAGIAAAAVLAMVLLASGSGHVPIFALLALVLAGSLGLGQLLRQRVVAPLRYATGKLGQCVAGDYFDWTEVAGSGCVGDLLRAVHSTQIKLGFEVTDAQRRAQEAARVKTALDCASTNVMMADADLNVVYMNDAVKRMFREAEAELKAQLPHFDAERIMGRNIDLFHAQPGHQRRLLANLRKTHSAELQVGVRTFRIIANPVIGDDGAHLGTVVEWADLTAQRAAERAEAERRELEARHNAENLRIRTALDNVSSCVMMADTDNDIIYMNRQVEELFRRSEREIARAVPGFEAAGMLGANIDSFHRDPDHQRHMVAALRSPMKTEIRLGDLTFGFTATPVVDAAGQRLGTVVEWVDRTRETQMEDELESIVASARAGQLSRRVAMEDKSGFFRHLALGVNALLDELTGVFRDISATLSAMSEGDLTRPMRRDCKGEFGRTKDDLNGMLVHISGIVVGLREATDAVNVAANEISAGNGNLSARTEQQAASLEETAASMEQLTATVRNNADSAQQADRVAAAARQLAEKGGAVVGRAVNAMDQIHAASSRIAEIIGVIDEIAFQTNLLALNASVEAARAGEQGRGFAVVATEVRSLASRSAAAAKEIKSLIGDSVGKVHAGSALVNESGATLGEIVDSVKEVGDIVAEIAAASAEQAAGIDQVSRAVTGMDEMTQQNAALAEQTSAASLSLYEKAQAMERTVAFFTVSSDPEGLLALPVEADDVPHRHPGEGDAGFDFFAARTAHLAWRQRLRDFLDGRQALSHAEAVSHRDCVLGKWLYGQGLDRYGHIDDMRRMEREHQRLHALIREIVDLKAEGMDAQAEARYREIGPLSDTIVALLKSVERRAAG